MCPICHNAIMHRLTPDQKTHGLCLLVDKYQLRLLPSTLQEIHTLTKPPLCNIYDAIATLFELQAKQTAASQPTQRNLTVDDDRDDYKTA